MRKRIAPTAIASLMLCLALAACGGQSASNQTENAAVTGEAQVEGQTHMTYVVELHALTLTAVPSGTIARERLPPSRDAGFHR